MDNPSSSFSSPSISFSRTTLNGNEKSNKKVSFLEPLSEQVNNKVKPSTNPNILSYSSNIESFNRMEQNSIQKYEQRKQVRDADLERILQKDEKQRQQKLVEKQVLNNIQHYKTDVSSNYKKGMSSARSYNTGLSNYCTNFDSSKIGHIISTEGLTQKPTKPTTPAPPPPTTPAPPLNVGSEQKSANYDTINFLLVEASRNTDHQRKINALNDQRMKLEEELQCKLDNSRNIEQGFILSILSMMNCAFNKKYFHFNFCFYCCCCCKLFRYYLDDLNCLNLVVYFNLK
jgi:hypothetical protein